MKPEIPKIKAEVKINLTDDKPFFFAPRRLSYDEKIKLEKIISDLIERRVIRPSNSEYASPIVLTRKKSGDLRLCIDYRALNKINLRDNYPLPLIDDQLDSLEGKKYFSLLDLKDGFHHLDVTPDSIKLTSIVTPFGQYEYLKMPFDLKTAPATFQRFVNTAFADLIKSGKISVYIDDVMIATRTLE